MSRETEEAAVLDQRWEIIQRDLGGLGLIEYRQSTRALSSLRQEVAELVEELEAFRRFLTRIASPDEITGDGPVEPVIEDPVGVAARELRARMSMAQRGLDGDQFP